MGCWSVCVYAQQFVLLLGSDLKFVYEVEEVSCHKENRRLWISHVSKVVLVTKKS